MNIYEEISRFYDEYKGEKRIIGSSAEGRNLYAFFVGEHKAPVLLSQYAIHAREWITSYLALAHIKRGVTCGGVWILPLMNPDGALLATEGLKTVKNFRREFLFQLNGSMDFSLWKANAEGVDLNVNFGAHWGKGKYNITHPASENYIGEAPFSAPETRALKEFTERLRPNATISWHTKGEEIYWRFHQPHARAKRDKKLADVLSESTGYALKETPHSAGGYKDWCVEKLKIPAFTVEAGNDAFTHPLGFHELGNVIVKNIHALADLSARM